MKFILSVVSVLLFSQSALAQEMYSCTPVRPTSLFTKVVLTDIQGPDYLLTVFKTDDKGNETEKSGVADFFDDMTLVGYYSEALEASLEFHEPVDLERVLFDMGDFRGHVKCEDKSGSTLRLFEIVSSTAMTCGGAGERCSSPMDCCGNLMCMDANDGMGFLCR